MGSYNARKPRLDTTTMTAPHQLKWIVGCMALLLLTWACERTQEGLTVLETPRAENTVDIIARGLTFHAPDEISSGWNTLRFINESGMEHFALLERLPEGISLSDQQSQVAPIFQQGMDLLNAGDGDAAMAKFGELPAWFGDIVFLGGPGFLSPGRTAEATLFIEPGTYLIECYVKTNGIFHSYNPDPNVFGMVHRFEVTEDGNITVAPPASLEVKVSSENGFELSGTPVIGKNAVKVRFVDQIVYENFVGHDVHIAKVPEDFSAEALVTWMNWTLAEGLETPAPVSFVGGINEMPGGTTAYFTVDLEPGTYAWIAEVPDADKKGMLELFTVTPD